MLWWFLILGASVGVIVSVATMLYVRLKQQMKSAKPVTPDETDRQSPSPQA
jgi:hypothetical protein